MNVTTCVVVWIEIKEIITHLKIGQVTTCVVVWIEILSTRLSPHPHPRHHLRGGVD